MAYSKCHSIDTEIAKKVNEIKKEMDGTLDEKINKSFEDKSQKSSSVKIDDDINERVKSIEKALKLLENSEEAKKKQLESDRLQKIKEECDKTIAERLKGYYDKNYIDNAFKKMETQLKTDSDSRFKAITEKSADLKKQVNQHEHDLMLLEEAIKHTGNDELIHTIRLRKSIDKFLEELLK